MTNKKKRQLNRYRCSLLLLVLLSIMAVVLLTSFVKNGQAEVAYTEYVVQTGDTLWDIATNCSDGHHDIRKIVYAMREKNNLAEATIHSGDVILVPVLSEEK